MPDQPTTTDNVIPYSQTSKAKGPAYANRNKKKLRAVKEPLPKKITVYTPGTLAFTFHRQKLDNPTVYAFLQHLQDEDPRIINLLKEYDELTDNQKAARPIWDKLCYKHEIPVGKLFGRLAEVILKFQRSEGYLQLATDTPDVMASLGKAAKKQKNLEHTRLFLETSGAIGNKSAININLQQNVDNRTLNVGLPALDETLKDNGSRKIREMNDRLLTEGTTTDFIDAELVSRKEKVEAECTIPRS